MFLNRKLFFGLLVVTSSAFSQENEQVKDSLKVNKLDEVIITATRTVRQLSSIPMPVTLVSKKQIEKSGSVRLKDILLEQTGITLVKDVGSSEGVQLQGIAADYTLILIDGVPVVGRTAGNIDLNRITVNNIKQIEIVKGPSSSLYGSEAMGGVINIITEKPNRDQLKGKYHLYTRGGAKNELDINGDIVYREGKFGIIAGVNLNSSKGFDLTPLTASKTVYPHQNYTLNAQVLYDVSEKLKLDFSQRYYNQNQYINSVTNNQTDWNANVKLNHFLTDKWDIDYTFYATRFKTESTLNNVTTLFNRSLFRPEIRSKYIVGNSGTIIAGVGGNFDELDRSSINGAKQYKAWYGFAQYDFNPINDVNVIVGARYEGSNSYQSAFSPKLSASYQLNDMITLKGSAGFGFKVPDFRQLFFDFRNVSNGYIVLGTHTIHNLFQGVAGVNSIEKQLKPETSIGYNIGFQFNLNNDLKINVNGFRNDIKDLIDTFDTEISALTVGLPRGTRTFSYRNINNVFTQGIEVDVNYKINKNFQFFTGYQFLDTGNKEELNRIKEGVFYRDENGVSQQLNASSYFGLVNRSKHMLNAKLFYENFEHNFSMNIRGVYRSKYAPFDTNGNLLIDDFDNFVVANTQINTAVTKEFLGFMNLQVGVDNLFNSTGIENKELFNYTDSNGNVIPNESYLQLGRTYYGRIQFNF
ncbi:TonB-dependent receptor plug domain-containing protein [Tenacibaculum halocynthiae]|uniref:TonB-dependent receptor plug domain-containing protein n=1 Tax=Tenacibaculum halocynthiae TaxID=1254437 RepID=UPI00389554DC